MILLGFASALRRSELVSLTLADVELKPAGLLLNVRQSKTDPKGHGQVVAVAHGQHARTDPVAALVGWRAVRGRSARSVVHPDLGQPRQPQTTLGPRRGTHAPGSRRSGRAGCRAGHLAARRPRHHRCPGRRPAQPDRRPDPAPRPVGPRQLLHPLARGIGDDVQPRPRAMTRGHGEKARDSRSRPEEQARYVLRSLARRPSWRRAEGCPRSSSGIEGLAVNNDAVRLVSGSVRDVRGRAGDVPSSVSRRTIEAGHRRAARCAPPSLRPWPPLGALGLVVGVRHRLLIRIHQRAWTRPSQSSGDPSTAASSRSRLLAMARWCTRNPGCVADTKSAVRHGVSSLGSDGPPVTLEGTAKSAVQAGGVLPLRPTRGVPACPERSLRGLCHQAARYQSRTHMHA